ANARCASHHGRGVRSHQSQDRLALGATQNLSAVLRGTGLSAGDVMDGTTGLLLAWVVVAAALWVGLWHSRAALPKWLLSPLVAAILALLGALLAGALRELLSRGAGVSNTSGAATVVSLFCLLVTGYVGGRSLGASRAADEYKRGSRLEDGAP